MKTALALVLVIFASNGVNAQESEAHQDTAPWRLVAKSHSILVGRLTVPLQQIEAANASDTGVYVDIEVNVTRALKGIAPTAPVAVRYFTKALPYSPSLTLLNELNGKDAMLFLVQIDEHGSAYFFINVPDALKPLSPGSLTQIESEVAAQVAILKAYQRPNVKDDAYRHVRKLVDNITHPERAEEAVSDLQSLGKEYVPAMIHLMNDRRPLPLKQITVKNPPGHWEGIAHYSPQCVVDVMSILLGRITGETFGSLYNGGSERERAAEVNAWRIYLHHLTTEPELGATGVNDEYHIGRRMVDLATGLAYDGTEHIHTLTIGVALTGIKALG